MREGSLNSFADCIQYLIRNDLEIQAIGLLCEHQKIKMQKLRSENASQRASMKAALKINAATCKNDAIRHILEDEE